MKLLICTQAVDKNHPILGFFHRWIEEFAKHCEEVHVICLVKGEYSLPSNVHVYSLGKEEGESHIKYLVRFYRYFSYVFFNVKVDFVFYHMGAIYNIVGAPFYLVRKLFKTKFYWWKAHGYISKTARIALLFVDAVVTSTESGFSVKTKKKKIVGQAIDTSLFTSREWEANREKKIIFVGRIMRVKCIEDFIEAAALLLKRDSSLRFEIIGPVGDETYFEELKKKIVVLGIETSISFTGSKRQEELVGIYQNALVFLNTSRTQSMDKTVLESSLCGCVPVTGNKAFIDLLQSEGLYLENPTSEQYARVIHTLLSEDVSHLRLRLREKVIAAHSLDTFTQRLFSI